MAHTSLHSSAQRAITETPRSLGRSDAEDDDELSDSPQRVPSTILSSMRLVMLLESAFFVLIYLLSGSSRVKSRDNHVFAFLQREVFAYTWSTSLFDLLIAVVWRNVLLAVYYRESDRTSSWPVRIACYATTLFLFAKIVSFDFASWSPLAYLLVVAVFAFSWSQVFIWSSRKLLLFKRRLRDRHLAAQAAEVQPLLLDYLREHGQAARPPTSPGLVLDSEAGAGVAVHHHHHHSHHRLLADDDASVDGVADDHCWLPAPRPAPSASMLSDRADAGTGVGRMPSGEPSGMSGARSSGEQEGGRAPRRRRDSIGSSDAARYPSDRRRQQRSSGESLEPDYATDQAVKSRTTTSSMRSAASSSTRESGSVRGWRRHLPRLRRTRNQPLPQRSSRDHLPGMSVESSTVIDDGTSVSSIGDAFSRRGSPRSRSSTRPSPAVGRVAMSRNTSSSAALNMAPRRASRAELEGVLAQDTPDSVLRLSTVAANLAASPTRRRVRPGADGAGGVGSSRASDTHTRRSTGTNNIDADQAGNGNVDDGEDEEEEEVEEVDLIFSEDDEGSAAAAAAAAAAAHRIPDTGTDDSAVSPPSESPPGAASPRTSPLAQHRSHRWCEQVSEAYAMLEEFQQAQDWKEVKQSGGLVVHRRKMKGRDFPAMRGAVTVPVQLARHIADWFLRVDERAEWDSNFREGRVVEQLSETTDVVHLGFKGMYPVQHRDVCQLRDWSHPIHLVHDSSSPVPHSEEFRSVSFSVEHEQCVLDSETYTRMNIYFAGLLMRADPEKQDHVQVTYWTTFDMGGSVPFYLKNVAMDRAPSVLADLRSHAEKLVAVLSEEPTPA